MKKFELVTIGSVLKDTIFYTAEGEVVANPKIDPTKLQLLGFELGAKLKSREVFFSSGGGAANTAVNFSGLNFTTGIIAALGADAEGIFLKKQLQIKGVDCSLLKTERKLNTGSSLIIVDKKSNEHVAFVYYGSSETLQLSARDLYKFTTDWFYIAALNSPYWEKNLTLLLKQSARFAWNPGKQQITAGLEKLNRYLKKVDVLMLNTDEATELLLSSGKKDLSIPQMLKALHQTGIKICLITDGAAGAYVYDGEKIYFQKPHHGKPKDTTGAGDCFCSTFIAGLIKFQDINKAMKMAMLNSAALVMLPGAQNGLLSWKQLKNKI